MFCIQKSSFYFIYKTPGLQKRHTTRPLLQNKLTFYCLTSISTVMTDNERQSDSASGVYILLGMAAKYRYIENIRRKKIPSYAFNMHRYSDAY